MRQFPHENSRERVCLAYCSAEIPRIGCLLGDLGLSLAHRTSRGVAQPGSASVLGTEGRRFESSHPDHISTVRSYGLMAVLKFPSVETADEMGLLAVGGDLEVESLLLAYRSGIFPWPLSDDGTLTWFSPPMRTLLFLDRVHISRTLKKKLKSGEFTFSFNTAFVEVINACAVAKNRKGQFGTWITEEMVEGYIELHHAGYAHSVECSVECKRGSRLVGGLYGVSIGGMFAGESMFYHETDASKLALCVLVERLREQGVEWIDCQQTTPLLSSFGAEEVERSRFIALLSESLGRKTLEFG